MQVVSHSRGLPPLLSIKIQSRMLQHANDQPQFFSILFIINKVMQASEGENVCLDSALYTVSGLDHSGASLTVFEGIWLQFKSQTFIFSSLSLLSVLAHHACLFLLSFSFLIWLFEVGVSRQSELSYTCH